MKKLSLSLIVLFSLGLVLTSCNDDDDDNGSPNGGNGNNNGNQLQVPDTYNWDDADYSGQTARIELLDRLSSEIGKAGDGDPVNEQKLIDIFENNDVISADKDLVAKTYEQDRQKFYDWFKKLDSVTNNPNAGDTIIDGRHYTAEGIEIQQMVEKGLMGACFYYQATSVYLNDLELDNNENPQEGNKATKMEHHFDEAFGYLGVPKNFLNNDKDEVDGDYVNSSWFWGHYIRSRNPELQVKEDLFNAFLKGRAAITQQKPNKRQEAVNTIKEDWELLVASNVAHYINSTISDIDNNAMGDKWHHWSEAKAFLMSLKYNVDKKISNTRWEEIDNLLKATPKQVTKEDLQQANIKLDEVYDFPTDITNF